MLEKFPQNVNLISALTEIYKFLFFPEPYSLSRRSQIYKPFLEKNYPLQFLKNCFPVIILLEINGVS